MKLSPSAWSLQGKILIPVLTCSFLLLAGFGSAVLIQRSKVAEVALQSKVTTMTTFLAASGVSYINNYDYGALESFVKFISADEDFAYLIFYDASDKAMTKDDSKNFEKYPYEDTDVIDGGKKIGYLRLYYKTDRLQQSSQQTWVMVVGGIILVEFLLGMAVLLILRTVTTQFRQMFGNLDRTSGILNTASDELEKGNSFLSEAFNEQAASIRTTVTTLDQITSTAQMSQQNAQQSALSAKKTEGFAKEVQTRVLDLVNSIQEINKSNEFVMKQVKDSHVRMNEVMAIIEEIGSKANVINEIVFQTRLLSFNASVEAARAGEHGRGFAVVAEEVGSLAAMSGKSANEIRNLLDQSKARVSQIVSEMEAKVTEATKDGGARVRTSMDVADRAKESIVGIVDQIGNLSELVDRISTAFAEQVVAVKNINETMMQISTASEESIKRLENSFTTSSQLKSESTTLVDAVDTLESKVFGKAA